MASNARNLSKLLGTSTQVPTTALPQAIADLETIGTSLSGGDIAPKNISSNTLTQSFDSNQTVNFIMSDSIDTISPIISVFKEVPQPGVSSKGNWDVNANATNYEFFDEKGISYSSVSLTPSATGDGTFTSSNPVVSGYDISLISSGYIRQINATSSSGGTFNESAEYSSDGTKIYFSQRNSDIIKVFSLSTAYDITTIAGTSSSEYTLSADAWSIRVNSAGTKMWVAYDASIEQFTLSTSHDVSTASSDGTWTVGTFIRDIRFNDDGTKIYIADIGTDDIEQYSLTTAYDITGTKTLDGSITGLTNPSAILFNSDGSKLYYGQQNNSSVYVKNLGTLYDITTNVSSGTTVAWDSGANSGSYEALDMSFNSNGTKLFILHSQSASPYHKFLSEFTSGSSNVFNSSEVGKKVVGNSGSAVITSTAGAYKSVTPFADTSAISSWQLYGAEGKSDGTGIQLAGFSLPHTSIDNPTHLNTLTWNSSYAKGRAIKISPDGTNFYAINYSSTASAQTVHRFSLSTPFDISTATFAETKDSVGQIVDALWNSNGTKLFLLGNSALAGIPSFVASTPYSLSNMTAGGNAGSLGNDQGGNTVLGGMCFNNDKTKLYISNRETNRIYEYDLNGSAGEIDGGLTFVGSVLTGVTAPMSIEMQSDGTKVWYTTLGDTTPRHHSMTLTTPFQISTAGSSTSYTFPSPVSTGTSTRIFCFNAEQTKMYVSNGSTTENVFEFNIGSFVLPYSQYFPALTNSSNGQINSSTWLDINSMTADETKNGGDIFYAVSTDNRTSWGVAKASDGVRKIARNNSGTWQYNNNAGTTVTVGFDIANASYDSKSLDVNAYESTARCVDISSDGLHLIMGGSFVDDLHYFTLSTAFDVSTATYVNKIDPHGTVLAGCRFSSTGHKVFTCDANTYKVESFDLSTAYDLSTAGSGTTSTALTTVSSNAQTGLFDFNFNNDGTKLFAMDRNGYKIHEYTLSTAWDITNLTYVDAYTYTAYSEGFSFNGDGTKLFILNVSGNDKVELHNLSVAFDISTASISSPLVSFDTFEQDNNSWGLCFGNSGQKMYVVGSDGNDTIYQYSTGSTTIGYTTSETWVNGTNNNEHATLQQALGAQSFNRMNKAQLDAVADGYHFSQDSADTLDLMIAPYAVSGASPVSDGVTINYDAEALIREAVAGTDYIAEFPSPNRLDIKSLINGNLKIRAQ